MSSVGEDFPRQQERVRKLWARMVKEGHEHTAEILDGILARAAEAQSSGDLLQILRSYGELTEVNS